MGKKTLLAWRNVSERTFLIENFLSYGFWVRGNFWSIFSEMWWLLHDRIMFIAGGGFALIEGTLCRHCCVSVVYLVSLGSWPPRMLAQKSTVCSSFMGMKLDFQVFPVTGGTLPGHWCCWENLPENGDSLWGTSLHDWWNQKRWLRVLWNCRTWVVLKSIQYDFLAESVSSVDNIFSLFLYSCLLLGRVFCSLEVRRVLKQQGKLSEQRTK